MPGQSKEVPEYYIIVGTVKETRAERVLPEHFEDFLSAKRALTADLQAAPPYDTEKYHDGSPKPLSFKIYGIKNGQRVSVESDVE